MIYLVFKVLTFEGIIAVKIIAMFRSLLWTLKSSVCLYLQHVTVRMLIFTRNNDLYFNFIKCTVANYLRAQIFVADVLQHFLIMEACNFKINYNEIRLDVQCVGLSDISGLGHARGCPRVLTRLRS